MSRQSIDDIKRQLVRSYSKLAHLKRITVRTYGLDAWRDLQDDALYQVLKQMAEFDKTTQELDNERSQI